jgi:hypothetical protein
MKLADMPMADMPMADMPLVGICSMKIYNYDAFID